MLSDTLGKVRGQSKKLKAGVLSIANQTRRYYAHHLLKSRSCIVLFAFEAQCYSEHHWRVCKSSHRVRERLIIVSDKFLHCPSYAVICMSSRPLRIVLSHDIVSFLSYAPFIHHHFVVRHFASCIESCEIPVPCHSARPLHNLSLIHI